MTRVRGPISRDHGDDQPNDAAHQTERSHCRHKADDNLDHSREHNDHLRVTNGPGLRKPTEWRGARRAAVWPVGGGTRLKASEAASDSQMSRSGLRRNRERMSARRRHAWPPIDWHRGACAHWKLRIFGNRSAGACVQPQRARVLHSKTLTGRVFVETSDSREFCRLADAQRVRATDRGQFGDADHVRKHAAGRRRAAEVPAARRLGGRGVRALRRRAARV